MKGLDTNFRGGNQIDGIWSSEDVDFHGAIFIPLWTKVEDHRTCVADISYKALIG